ncbi:MAG TPA: VOC family protein [Ignavibacteria bacterium]|nr:VOC family protein [Ignavibacteria bacterium]HMR41337.1 VOC family protein [Ignavibacteria bacterium]
MITKFSHYSVFVLNQEEALKFYTEKLGCSIKTDTFRGDYRWLTVVFPEQPDVEIILVPVEEGPLFDKETAEAISTLVRKGAFGMGVLHTRNIYATFIEMSEKGVNFLKEPGEIQFGIEALFEDNSGNWFSLLQNDQDG